MVNNTNKLPLKDILAAIDMNAKNVWNDLSDDERKQVSFYLLNRYASAIKYLKQISITINIFLHYPNTKNYYGICFA